VTLSVLVLFTGSLSNDDLVLASHCKRMKYTEKCHEHVMEIMYVQRINMATKPFCREPECGSTGGYNDNG